MRIQWHLFLHSFQDRQLVTGVLQACTLRTPLISFHIQGLATLNTLKPDNGDAIHAQSQSLYGSRNLNLCTAKKQISHIQSEATPLKATHE